MAAPKINLPELIKANQARWDAAKFSPRRLQIAAEVAVRLCADKAKAIYKELEAVTSVPWYIIAVIHEREASQRWDRSIAQGDPWNRKSTHVPKGRGPFRDFKSAAIDALTKCAPFASRWKDWSEGGALTLLELYNGTGYERYHHMASPYLWAGTDQYTRGKYVADGQFDGSEVDLQLGCAVLLKQMMAHDPEVTFGQSASPAGGFDDHPDAGNPPDLDPDNYPDPSEAPTPDPHTPPGSTYVDGPPPATTPPAKPDVSSPDTDSTLKTVKDAIGAKIGTKTVAATTAATSTAVASADDSWFTAIGHALHNPRFWIIAVIVLSAVSFIVWEWVKEHKANQQ